MNENFLNIFIKDFSSQKFYKNERKGSSFSINILQSGLYTINTTNENISSFFNILSGTEKCFRGEIKLNNVSIREDKNVVKYIQKNVLFLEKVSLFEELSVKENIKIFSKLWSGEDLSDFAIAYFKLHKVSHLKIKQLNASEIQLINITKLISCPTSIWFIKDEIIKKLDQNSNNMLEKLIDSRLKQNGVIFFLRA